MVIKTHDVSRLRFLDFDTWPMIINLKFNVCDLQMEQDIVAVFGEHRVQVFQILIGTINQLSKKIIYALLNKCNVFC